MANKSTTILYHSAYKKLGQLPWQDLQLKIEMVKGLGQPDDMDAFDQSM